MSDNFSPPTSQTPIYFKRITKTYNISFLGTLGAIYINGGFKILFSLVFIEILRTEYDSDPDNLQLFLTYVMISWDFKVLFGIIADTVKLPLGKSFNKAPRRGYIISLSFI